MRYLILLLAALLTSAAIAIDPPKPPVPAAERPDIADADKEAAAKAKAEADAQAEAADDEVLPPLPADMVPAGPPPARFNPTEKVRADFPVSFPIDI